MDINRTRSYRPLIVFSILLFVYLLTFSGFYSTDDEQLFGALTANLAQGREYSALPLFGNDRLQGRSGSVEPLHPLLGIPLYKIADKFGLGKAQILFLLPAIYTAVTASFLGLIAKKKGYSSNTAYILGFAFGLGTIAFPYARTNFREPLASLCITASVLCIESCAEEGQKIWKNTFFPIIGLILLGLAALTKLTAVVLVPFIFAYYLVRKKPFIKKINTQGLFLVLFIFFLLILAGSFIISTLPAASVNRFTIQFINYLRYTLPRLPHDHFWTGLAGLLISPGKGLLVYSPMLSLILASPFIKHKSTSDWLIFSGALFTAAAVQALIYNGQWWSISWGTRSLIPVLPLACLAVLPALDAGLNQSKKWIKNSTLLLLILGGCIQVVHLLTSDPIYLNWVVKFTGQSVNNMTQWGLDLMPLFRYWQLAFSNQSSDIAWLYLNQFTPFIFLVIFSLIGIALGVFLLIKKRSAAPTLQRLLFGLITTALILTPISAQFDQRYNRNVTTFQASSAFVCEHVQPTDIILIDSYLDPFWWFYTNFGCSKAEWVGLAAQYQTAVYNDQFFPRFSELLIIVNETISKEQKVFLIRLSQSHSLSYSEEFERSGIQTILIFSDSNPDIQIFEFTKAD